MKLFTALFASLLLAAPAGAALVTLNPLPTGNVFVGIPFEVEVMVSGNTDEVVAFGFDLALPAGLTLNSFTMDPAFLDFSGIVAADVAGIADPLPIALPSFSLGRLNFTATVTGPLVITVSTNATTNFDHGLFFLGLPTEEISATATVNSTVIPEPSTLALGFAGFVAVVALRRR